MVESITFAPPSFFNVSTASGASRSMYSCAPSSFAKDSLSLPRAIANCPKTHFIGELNTKGDQSPPIPRIATISPGKVPV